MTIRICGDEHMGVRLGNICRFQSGGTPSKGKPEFFNGTIPWITTTALNGGNIGKESAVDWISEQAIKESAAKIVPAFSIMVGTRVGVGKVAINTTSMSTSQDIVSLLDIDESVWSKAFLCKFLQAKGTFLNSQARGATIKGIKIDVLSELELPEIPMEEQQHISQIIDKIKAIIVIRQQQLQKLDELVKARFVELFGDLANPSCLWKTIKLVDACASADDIKCGPFGTQLGKGEYVDSGIAVWEIPQINTAFKACPTHFITEEKATQLKAYSLVPGDIAMSRKGNVGRCAIFPDEYVDGIIHSDVLRIRVNEQKVNPVFMMYQLHFSSAVINQIEMVSSGAIMAGVNVTKLKQIHVHIPPKQLQDQFASFVKQTDKSKAAIQKALDEAQLLFDSLMQKYFG